MKKPQKFTLPRSIIAEVREKSSRYCLSASGFIEVALEYLQDAPDPKALVQSQEDNTLDMIGVCYAISESDAAFIKKLCQESSVTKRAVMLAAIALFAKNFRASYE